MKNNNKTVPFLLCQVGAPETCFIYVFLVLESNTVCLYGTFLCKYVQLKLSLTSRQSGRGSNSLDLCLSSEHSYSLDFPGQ